MVVLFRSFRRGSYSEVNFAEKTARRLPDQDPAPAGSGLGFYAGWGRRFRDLVLTYRIDQGICVQHANRVLWIPDRDSVQVEFTGFNHNPGAGFPNQATDVFFIKGSSSPSVVPHNPNWTP